MKFAVIAFVLLALCGSIYAKDDPSDGGRLGLGGSKNSENLGSNMQEGSKNSQNVGSLNRGSPFDRFQK